MLYQVNGLKDIYTVVTNERKLGGAVEADFIRLRSGELFHNVVISHIDTSGLMIYSVSFVTEEGKKYITHVNDISMISEPNHKHIKDLKNTYFKEKKTEEKMKYLVKLCTLNQGSCTKPFLDEVLLFIEDFGKDAIRKHLDLDDIEHDKKVISIIRKVS
jgi:hypothetical protein